MQDAADVPDARDDLTGRALVVVGINYAPEHTGIAPYTTAVCRDLAEHGAHVTMVTGVPHYPSWTVDPRYRRTLRRRERDGDVNVVRIRHYVPRRQDALRRAAFEASWMPGALASALSAPADAVLAISPPLGALPVARGVARARGIPWAAVVQDLMGGAARHSGVAGGGRVAQWVDRIESSALRKADLVGVIGGGFHSSVVDMGVRPSRVRLVPNWTHIETNEVTVAQARSRLGWAQDEFIVAHTGNMGLKQGLDSVVEAARIADRVGSGIKFVLVGDGSRRSALEEQGRGVRSLWFVPPVSAEVYPFVLAAADVLLVNEIPDMVEMSLPSKLTSYLAAGRQVVAAVPRDGWTAQLLEESQAAVTVAPADPQALVEAVEKVRDDVDGRRLREMSARSFAQHRLSADAALARYRALVRELVT